MLKSKGFYIFLALQTVFSEKYSTKLLKKSESISESGFLQPKQLLHHNYLQNVYNTELSKLKSSIELYKLKIQARQKERDKIIKKSLQQMSPKCRKIKCPLDEKPVCAKFTYKNNKHKPFYVKILNNCEMQYMKCQRGMEATIVPLTNCHAVLDMLPIDTQFQARTSQFNQKSAKRLKREIEADPPKEVPKKIKDRKTQTNRTTSKYKETNVNSSMLINNSLSNFQSKLKFASSISTTAVPIKTDLKIISTKKVSKKQTHYNNNLNHSETKSKLLHNMSQVTIILPENNKIKAFTTKENLKSSRLHKKTHNLNDSVKPSSIKTQNNSRHVVSRNLANTKTVSTLKVMKNNSPVSVNIGAKKIIPKTAYKVVAEKIAKDKNIKRKITAKNIFRTGNDVRAEMLDQSQKNLKLELELHDDEVQKALEKYPIGMHVLKEEENTVDLDQQDSESVPDTYEFEKNDFNGEKSENEFNYKENRVQNINEDSAIFPAVDNDPYRPLITEQQPELISDKKFNEDPVSVDYEDVPQHAEIINLVTIKDEDTQDTDQENSGEHGESSGAADFESITRYATDEPPSIEYDDNKDAKNDDGSHKTYVTSEPPSTEYSDSKQGGIDVFEGSKKYTSGGSSSMESDGMDGIDEVDKEEMDAECPRQCPARDSMVCAMCDHGIYRTFLSVCHMRMFACQERNRGKKLELVSRYPCVMSAPYITDDPPMQPKGHVSEPEAEDRVLQYIRCRERGMLGKSLTCMFEDEEEYSYYKEVETDFYY